MTDEVPDWSEGEHLTGDAYVKWIRKLRVPPWVRSASSVMGIDPTELLTEQNLQEPHTPLGNTDEEE